MIRVISGNTTIGYSEKWYKLFKVDGTEFYKLYVVVKNGVKQIATLKQKGSYFVKTQQDKEA